MPVIPFCFFKRSFHFILCIAILVCSVRVHAQNRISFHDSLDHSFDMSDWLIKAHGFIPVVSVITEPALGGFGVAGGLVFLKKNPPVMYDAINVPQAPDITTVMGGYTANGTWFTGAARMGRISKLRLKYTVFGGYADVNMAYYFKIKEKEEKFVINAKTIPVHVSAVRQLRNPKWNLGLQYLFLTSKIKSGNEKKLPDTLSPLVYDSKLSMPGLIGEYDSRDNMFTPDNGLKVHLDVNFSQDFFGSDYNYQHINTYAYYYHSIGKHWQNGKNWICGLRADMQQVFGSPPFYVVPSIDMRGIPIMRYQGNTNLLVETEQRWDFVRRWSLVFFAGAGKAFDKYSDWNDADLVYSYGTGFRYLLARKFKLRMGIDVAKGPDDIAYYIVFGSSWLK